MSADDTSYGASDLGSPSRTTDEGEGWAPPTAAQFQRVEQLRAHEYVAEQIRRQIALRLIPSGQALPPERELARIFGVGRATVQHALRLLEADRLVEARRGRHGGTFVRGPDGKEVDMDHLLVEIRRNRESIEEVLVYQRAVEPAAATEAAKFRTSQELGLIREAFERAAAAKTDADFLTHDTRFHLAIAEASRNRFFVEAVERARLTLSGVLVALPHSRCWHERCAQEHASILSTLEAKDPERARKAMLEHVENVSESISALLSALHPLAET